MWKFTTSPKSANSHLPVKRPFLKTLYQSVYDSLVAAVNKHLHSCNAMYNCVQNSWNFSDLKMYDKVYTAYPDTDYKFTYEESLAKAEEVLAVLGSDYLSCKTSLQRTVDWCMSTKENAQVLIQVVLAIPMPSCCWTGKIHWIISLHLGAWNWSQYAFSYKSVKPSSYVYGDYSLKLARKTNQDSLCLVVTVY